MPSDRTQDDEIARLTGLGARIVEDRRPEFGWVVLADPEGNEFDVEISLTQLDEDQRRSLFNQAVPATDGPVQR